MLVLGGTGEARDLATMLQADRVPVVSSLAGRVSDPALPVGTVRVGGFGGVSGLVGYLTEHAIQAVVDATHPFAAQISGHAAQACTAAGVPLLRLQRPSWREHPLSGEWTWVSSHAEAAQVGTSLGRRPFLSTGRQTLRDFLSWADRYVLVRVVQLPDWELPTAWEVLSSRGPYHYRNEHRVLAGHQIDLLVTKDSGGPLTQAKLQAAHDLGIPVLVVSRPQLPDGVPVVTDPDAARRWVHARSGTGSLHPDDAVASPAPDR